MSDGIPPDSKARFIRSDLVSNFSNYLGSKDILKIGWGSRMLMMPLPWNTWIALQNES